MKHLVLFRVQPGGLTEERKRQIEQVYAQLAELVEGLRSVKVYYNCVDREQNLDVMVEMELDGPQALKAYLEHPLHVEFAADSREFISQAVSFDYRVK